MWQDARAVTKHDANDGRQSRASQFRRLLDAKDVAFLMEAHDALSGRIVEETGFSGIWASGLSIASALGLRDANEASWCQVLEVVELMADATSVPILMDGDTGYGNFNNVRRLVRKLEQRGVAALCLEDKLFPKLNSFVGERQPLADRDEFCGRIKAGKDAQQDDAFCLIARVEALISGHGLDEALSRAEAYHAAGADGILIHSKRTEPDEILAFSEAWQDRCPLVIVPTKYYRAPADLYRQAGISIVIWANHTMRAAIAAMRRVCGRIHSEEGVAGIEAEIASLDEVFRLMRYGELTDAEARYLPLRAPES